MEQERIPAEQIAAYREALLACFRGAIAGAYARQVLRGHTIARMARKLGWSEKKMIARMAVPSDMELGEIAEICWSMMCEPTLRMGDGCTYVCVTPRDDLCQLDETAAAEPDTPKEPTP